MTETIPTSDHAKVWQMLLGHEHKTIFSALPHDPRCQICRIPFAGFGGLIGRAIGFKRWNKNPTLCNRCVDSMPAGGIEIDTAVLFADIRGSTALAERLGPSEFAGILNRYYRIATDVLASRRAIIDKMIGDEVMALFLPLAGKTYRRAAVESAIALQHAVNDATWEGEAPRIGIGVFAGVAFIGRVGEENAKDFTALGDTVNVAARLQSEALAGEVIIGEELYSENSDLFQKVEQRSINVRGRQQPVNVHVAPIISR